MKVSRIIYQPRFVVEFSRSEVEELRDLSRSHYDFTCRQLSVPGEGAVINGLLNRFEDGKDTVESGPLTSDQLQLLCKCAEMSKLPATPTSGIWWELFNIVRRIEDEWKKANAA